MKKNALAVCELIGHVLVNMPARYQPGTTDKIEITIPTLEGDMIARHGDWIVEGVNGELYPVKADIFDKTYER